MLLAHLDPAQNQIVGIVLLGDVASAAWGITQLGVTELRFPHQPQAVLSSILHPRSYRAVKDDGRLAAHAVKIVGETLIRAGVLESCTTLWDSFRSFYDCPLRSSADMIEVQLPCGSSPYCSTLTRSQSRFSANLSTTKTLTPASASGGSPFAPSLSTTAVPTLVRDIFHIGR